jgi:hypothetical protein
MTRADLATVVVVGLLVWLLWPRGKSVPTFTLDPVVISAGDRNAE